MHEFFSQIEPCLIGMEACGSAHYWGRELNLVQQPAHLILCMGALQISFASYAASTSLAAPGS